jgi:hypothetical protein
MFSLVSAPCGPTRCRMARAELTLESRLKMERKEKVAPRAIRTSSAERRVWPSTYSTTRRVLPATREVP